MPEPPVVESTFVVPNVCGVAGAKVNAACGVLNTSYVLVNVAAASQLLLPTCMARMATVPEAE